MPDSNLNTLNEDLLFGQECYRIIGACMEVHGELGPGFLEAVYEEATSIEFRQGKIPFRQQPPLKIYYKGIKLEKSYCPDFICFGEIIVELKAAKMLHSEHYAQVLNYLKATNSRLGLLINFGADRLEFKRIIK